MNSNCKASPESTVSRISSEGYRTLIKIISSRVSDWSLYLRKYLGINATNYFLSQWAAGLGYSKESRVSSCFITVSLLSLSIHKLVRNFSIFVVCYYIPRLTFPKISCILRATGESEGPMSFWKTS